MRPPFVRRSAVVAWGLAGLLLVSLVVFGGRRPFIPNEALWTPFFCAYFFLSLSFLAYVLLGYRQSDPGYPYGWKAARKDWRSGRRAPAVNAVIALPVMAAPVAWFLLMPTEVALGAVAQALESAPTQRLSATCQASYGNRLRGPVNELLVEGQRKVKLFGYGYLCGNRVGAPIPNAVHDIVLTARASALGLWVTNVEPAR